MNVVQPIRDPEKVRQIEHYLAGRSRRDCMLFVTGINSGLRISDLLNLRVLDVQDDDLVITEKKTRKRIPKRINPRLREALTSYTRDMSAGDYLFPSRQGENRPITRARAYQILTQAARKHGLKRIGTHTLRKTFGYHFYQATKDPVLLQQIFGHADQSITLRYIGIDQDKMDRAMARFTI